MKTKILMCLLIVGCGGAEVASDFLIASQMGEVVSADAGTPPQCPRADGGALLARGTFQGGRIITAISSDPICSETGWGKVGELAGDHLSFVGQDYCMNGSCHTTVQVGCNVTITHTLPPPGETNPLGTYQIVRTGTLVELPDGGTRIQGSATATGTGKFCPWTTYGTMTLDRTGP